MLNEIDLSRADLNLLVLFEVVLDERHVGRAAERLSLTPSAVSHGLGRLRRLLNDPLFLRTPKGVVPTARAMELAGPVARHPGEGQKRRRHRRAVRPGHVRCAASRSGRRTASRRCCCRRSSPGFGGVAPGVDISVKQLLPPRAAATSERAWQSAFADLEARALDIAIVPFAGAPPRFVERTLYEEDFVVASRAGHPYARKPGLERFCTMQHLLVSLTGDAHGFVDEMLAKRGLSRRIALTVPNFMMALALIAETDLIAALPRRLVAMHAARLGLTSTEAPLPFRRDRIQAVVSKAAMMDAGVAWLFGVLYDAQQPGRPVQRKRRQA